MTGTQPIASLSNPTKKAVPDFLRRNKNILLVSLTIFVISIIYNLTFNRIFILDIDEAHLIKRIMAVLTGEIPLIDFKRFTYAPGRYWFFGFLFKIFGPSLALERLTWVIFRSLVNVLTYLTARYMIPRHFVFIPVVLSMTMACVPFKTLFPFLTVLNLLMLLEYIKTEERKWLWISGLTAGLTIWIRQDISGFLLIAAFLCFLFQHVSILRLSLAPPRIKASIFLKPVFKKTGLFLGALILPFLPLVAFYGLHGIAHIFVWEMFIGGPLALASRREKMAYHFPNVGDIFQTPLNWDVIFLWIPVFIFVSVLFLLAKRLIRQKRLTKHDLYVLATLVMAVLTFNQTFQFAIFERLLENAVPIYILVGYLLALTYSAIRSWLDARMKGKIGSALIQWFAVSLLLLAPAAFVLYGLTQKNVNDRFTCKRLRQEIVCSDIGVWLVKGQLYREIHGVRRAIAKGSHQDDQIVFINTALIFYYGTKRGLANYDMHIEYFKEDNLSRYFDKYDPEYVAVENWASKYFHWLSPSFRQDFESDYIPIATRAGHTVFMKKQGSKRKKG